MISVNSDSEFRLLFLMALFILSFDMLDDSALLMAALSLGLESGSSPPILDATEISRISLEKSFALFYLELLFYALYF